MAQQTWNYPNHSPYVTSNSQMQVAGPQNRLSRVGGNGFVPDDNTVAMRNRMSMVNQTFRADTTPAAGLVPQTAATPEEAKLAAEVLTGYTEVAYHLLDENMYSAIKEMAPVQRVNGPLNGKYSVSKIIVDEAPWISTASYGVPNNMAYHIQSSVTDITRSSVGFTAEKYWMNTEIGLRVVLGYLQNVAVGAVERAYLAMIETISNAPSPAPMYTAITDEDVQTGLRSLANDFGCLSKKPDALAACVDRVVNDHADQNSPNFRNKDFVLGLPSRFFSELTHNATNYGYAVKSSDPKGAAAIGELGRQSGKTIVPLPAFRSDNSIVQPFVGPAHRGLYWTSPLSHVYETHTAEEYLPRIRSTTVQDHTHPGRQATLDFGRVAGLAIAHYWKANTDYNSGNDDPQGIIAWLKHVHGKLKVDVERNTLVDFTKDPFDKFPQEYQAYVLKLEGKLQKDDFKTEDITTFEGIVSFVTKYHSKGGPIPFSIMGIRPQVEYEMASGVLVGKNSMMTIVTDTDVEASMSTGQKEFSVHFTMYSGCHVLSQEDIVGTGPIYFTRYRKGGGVNIFPSGIEKTAAPDFSKYDMIVWPYNEHAENSKHVKDLKVIDASGFFYGTDQQSLHFDTAELFEKYMHYDQDHSHPFNKRGANILTNTVLYPEGVFLATNHGGISKAVNVPEISIHYNPRGKAIPAQNWTNVVLPCDGMTADLVGDPVSRLASLQTYASIKSSSS